MDEAQLSDPALNSAGGWGFQYDSLGRVIKAKHGPYTAPDMVRGFGFDQLDIGSAVDAWFWMNYGFGLRDALNGTSGDCLFSGGGSVSCSAGGFTHAGYSGNSTGLRRPPSLFFIADRQFLGCPDRVAGITGGGRLYQGTHVTVPTLLFRLTGDPGLYLLTRNYRGHIEAYGTGDVVLFDGDVEGEAQCWFAPHGLFISTEWRSN